SIYKILEDKKIKQDKKTIYLLRKTRSTSIHRELRTYYWWLKYKVENDKDYSFHSHEATPFLSVFYRPAGEFSVQFDPEKGYIVRSDFDTQIELMTKIEDNKWEQVFSSEEVQKVEDILDKINQSSSL
ncbi:MAG: hypothetical protein FWG49_01380, partial [Leptospirales bacterium]|nr:hypothetical protein [Leptospirales bacterium]